MKNNILRNSLLLGLALGIMYCASKIAISFTAGTHSFHFSGINLIFPILASLLALPQSLVALGLFYFVKMLFGSALTFGIPTFLATTNWSVNFSSDSSKNKTTHTVAKIFLQIILPLTCMMLFIMHPQGRGAFLYSFYWFVPMICFAIQMIFKKSWTFSTALSSTFIAHATGSIITLYTLAIPTQAWIKLIPLVAIERIIFASGATLLFHVMKTALTTATNISHLVENIDTQTDIN